MIIASKVVVHKRTGLKIFLYFLKPRLTGSIDRRNDLLSKATGEVRKMGVRVGLREDASRVRESNFGRRFDSESIHSTQSLGCLAIGELAMRPKYAVQNGGEHSNDASFRGGESAFEEHANDVFCLLQENARLRAHVAKLSSLLKNYLQQD
ncbi:MAG TPA: hypothetical protein VKB08_05070 [Bradyrhizobium sp.]|nr:hypothetical protein [Bradyrhizobium sp.]